LVLDEPTNHLDLWASDALEQALLDFDGTVIAVSHDRFFLNRVAQVLIVLEGDGPCQVIHGNYDTYERMRAMQEANSSQRSAVSDQRQPSVSQAKDHRNTATDNRQQGKQRRKRRFPYRKIEDLEADIATQETRLRDLEKRMASPELYRDGDKVKETTRAFE